MSNAKLHKGGNKLPLSSYWSSPIPGGLNSNTVESIALARYAQSSETGGDNTVIEEEFNQLSIPCDNECINVSYPNHVDLWGEFSNKRAKSKKTPKQGTHKDKTSLQ